MAAAPSLFVGLALLLLGHALAEGLPGEYGCGVAIAGDWPYCGAQFDTTYAFDLRALMASAERAAGRPLWRYDWRATQHPVWGGWTYLAMDWCPHGGRNEHPDPRGPWPGLLGWNEPNSPQQCGQNFWEVTEFVGLAKRYKALGKFVVSPAPTHDAHWWLDGFLGAMHGSTDPNEHFLGVDYLAYHHYVECNPGDADGYPATTADDVFAQLEGVLLNFIGVMDKWNGQGMSIKGLWLTEVACGWVNGRWTGSCGQACVANTMQSLIRLVRTYPQLKTWSWFAYNNFGNLWVDDRTKGYPLTELGWMYFRNCNPSSAAPAVVIAPATPATDAGADAAPATDAGADAAPFIAAPATAAEGNRIVIVP